MDKLFIKRIIIPKNRNMSDFSNSENKAGICNEVEILLGSHPDVLAPVKEILNVLKKRKDLEDLTYDELVSFLKSDDRFDFILIPERIETSEDSPELAQNIEKVENLGFYSGSRVKLKNAHLDVEKVVDILNRKVDLMMEVLVNIWDKRPMGDSGIEDNLLDILARAQKLQREVKDAINPEKIKHLSDSDNKNSQNNSNQN
jgi:hypothetical protein